jgi:hypothetical protein
MPAWGAPRWPAPRDNGRGMGRARHIVVSDVDHTPRATKCARSASAKKCGRHRGEAIAPTRCHLATGDAYPARGAGGDTVMDLGTKGAFAIAANCPRVKYPGRETLQPVHEA